MIKKDQTNLKSGRYELEGDISPTKELELRDFYHQHITRLNSLRVVGENSRIQIDETRRLRLEGLKTLPYRPRGVTFDFDERRSLVRMYYKGKSYIPRKGGKGF